MNHVDLRLAECALVLFVILKGEVAPGASARGRWLTRVLLPWAQAVALLVAKLLAVCALRFLIQLVDVLAPSLTLAVVKALARAAA